MADTAALDELIESLRCLPGVGPKSAQRMAYHLLQRNRRGAERLGHALGRALDELHHCARCNNYTGDEICARCRSPQRDPRQLCIVEMPVDLNSMEQSHAYKGLYYVLMGRISPLDGIGPRELNFERLIARATDGVVEEVILATNLTNEGELTAHTLSEILTARGLKVSRIARGLPVGAELEYADLISVAQAFIERRDVK